MNIQILDIAKAFKEFKKSQNSDQFIGSWNKYMNLMEEATQIQQIQNYIGLCEMHNDQFQPYPKVKQQSQNIKYKTKNDEDDLTETISLSFISEQLSELNIQETPDWMNYFTQYGKLFKPFGYFINFIITNKFDQILNNNFRITIQDKGYQGKLYCAYNIIKQDWIILKKQICKDEELLVLGQQFINHQFIQKQYPEKFLELIQPVYILGEEQNNFFFLSQLEYGEINLFDYIQQNKIEELEFWFIFQQVYQQIKLLHRHKIAHRDIKPQNIVFVQRKGWLLCDFGDSLKYENVDAIYDIRGTYAFLQPHLQQLSFKQGILVKQNLYANDIYALAITLIIIKYQITHEELLSNYLEQSGDKIIDSLINSPHEFTIQDHLINNQVPFIPIQLKKNKKTAIEEVSMNQIESFIEVLRIQQYFGEKINHEIKIKLLTEINKKLQQDNVNFHYLSLLCYSRIPEYINHLSHIVKFERVRQSRFWKQLYYDYQITGNRINLNMQIRIMFWLGLQDLTIRYARIFLQVDYDFEIHLMMISILMLQGRENQAIQEYNLILGYRQNKYMNRREQELFIIVSLNLVQMNKYSEEDTEYINQSTTIELIETPPKSILESDDSVYLHYQNITSIFKGQYEKQFLLAHAGMYINKAQELVNLDTVLKLIELIQQYIKYFCTSLLWQKLLFYQICIHNYVQNRHQLKIIFKEMNYVLMFKNESFMQQQQLRIYKLSYFGLQKIKKQSKYLQISKYILNFYKSCDSNFQQFQSIISDVLSITCLLLDNEKNKINNLKIIIYLLKDTQQHINQFQFQLMLGFINIYLIQTLNIKRSLLITKDSKKMNLLKQFSTTQGTKFYLNQYLQFKQYRQIEKVFLYEQHLYKS